MNIRVFVYWNLHRKCWSVKALEGERKGKLVAHEEFVVLRDATPKISEAGRQRVLREKRKNVHAGVVGEWVQGDDAFDDSGALYNPYHITYNPYRAAHFTWEGYSDGIGWHGSPWALLYANTEPAKRVMVFEEM